MAFTTTTAHKAAAKDYWGFMLRFAENGTPFLGTKEYAQACENLNKTYQARREEILRHRRLRANGRQEA